MQHSTNNAKDIFNVRLEDILTLFKNQKDAEAKVKWLLFIVSIICTPLTLIGIFWGYVRGFNRFMRDKQELPLLVGLPAAVRWGMFLFGITIWLVLIVGFYALIFVFKIFFSAEVLNSPAPFILLGLNLVFTFAAFAMFERWRNKVFRLFFQKSKYGTAAWARAEDLADLVGKNGIYIGGDVFVYSKQGHGIIFCRTRGGKGANFIGPNLLGKGGYDGSLFIVDVKAENVAISERYQRSIPGRTVLVLDPFALHTKNGATFNPLDLLSSDAQDDQLPDYADAMAEMILPLDAQAKDPFFNDRARSLICGLIMFIAISKKDDERSLTTLWEMLRLSSEDFTLLLAEMVVSENPIVQATAQEVENVLTATPKTFASILSTAQQFTDFLKSAPLQRSLTTSNFDINTLSNGTTTLYVVIPAELIDTKFPWLRLIVTSALKAVIKNRDKRVTFLLDEFSSLGYMKILETAINTLSGYNISLWPILTSLTALKNVYPNSWENFLSNTAVRQFTSIGGDLATAEYVSALLGDTTMVSTDGGKHEATARRLLTPDEVRRGSEKAIFTFIEERPPIDFPKLPYWEMPDLNGRHDPNPYYTGQ